LRVTVGKTFLANSSMSPLDTNRSIGMASAGDFDQWLRSSAGERDVIVAIYKKASGKQTVTFDALLETALCHGWVDTQTKSIDDERYAIRFVPRRVGSNWSETNRRIAKRLLAEGRFAPAGKVVLPGDL
jgi:uncharacterized protein YdeI (YjbR/CyaY-like superfamily)